MKRGRITDVRLNQFVFYAISGEIGVSAQSHFHHDTAAVSANGLVRYPKLITDLL